MGSERTVGTSRAEVDMAQAKRLAGRGEMWVTDDRATGLAHSGLQATLGSEVDEGRPSE